MNKYQSGPFGIPQGQVCVETPDGVLKTEAGGHVCSNMLHADYVYGGYDGRAIGAFDRQDYALPGSDAAYKDRFRVG